MGGADGRSGARGAGGVPIYLVVRFRSRTSRSVILAPRTRYFIGGAGRDGEDGEKKPSALGPLRLYAYGPVHSTTHAMEFEQI